MDGDVQSKQDDLHKNINSHTKTSDPKLQTIPVFLPPSPSISENRRALSHRSKEAIRVSMHEEVAGRKKNRKPKKLYRKSEIGIGREKGSIVVMASSSDPSKTVMERKKKGAPIKFLVPLIYAPVLPLIRLSLRHKPVLRDRLFGLVLAGAFAHGFYLVTDIYDAESK
ncbi:hypothetical protein EUTSA_v10019233mg [Eutrema salsugineum]|uniref:Uncharacterized protein n=2 Tax=Eutrema salsugineum TaxID=72664 RepID=V4MB19_EUTSA|nr:hypothetical protein EUTSA_v10019233mg [Eutrema salsugineum]